MASEHTILVLEDDRSAREAIVDSLAESGWFVQSASSASQALNLAEDTRPDLAICDWRVKGRRTGVDVARELQNRFGTEVILISGDPISRLRKATSDIRVTRYFAKPLSLSMLTGVVRTVMSGLANAANTPPD